MDSGTVSLLLSLGGVLVSGAIAWGVVRTKVSAVEELSNRNRDQVNTLFDRVDEVNGKMAVAVNRLDTISAWTEPKDVIQRAAEGAAFRAEVNTILADHQKHLDKISDRMFCGTPKA